MVNLLAVWLLLLLFCWIWEDGGVKMELVFIMELGVGRDGDGVIIMLLFADVTEVLLA